MMKRLLVVNFVGVILFIGYSLQLNAQDEPQECDAGGCGSIECSIGINASGSITTGVGVDTSQGVSLECVVDPSSGYWCCCYGDEGTWWNPWDNAEVFAPTISSSELGCDIDDNGIQ